MSIFRWFICVTFLMALEASSFAHARLVRSTPAKGEALARPPEQIELWFNELLDEGFNSLEIFAVSEAAGTKRANLAKGKPAVNRRDRTHLISKTEPLAPGEYVVEWRVLSRDGHSAPGRFTFRISDR